MGERSDYALREKSANGEPKPLTSIERRCVGCGASFLGLAPGKTGERGLWTSDLRWFCSVECQDRDDRVLR